MTSTERETFDYIVVGAGSAGAALANRLSADQDVSVLLLEAGGPDTEQNIHVPIAFPRLFKSDVDWNYQTEKQPAIGGRSVYWPRGKVLGGSSSINAMMWVRGFAADYDRWAELAGPGWSWDALLPYFRRAEAVEGATDPDQGTDGAISISHQRSPRSHTAAFLQAAAEVGIPPVAPNLANPEGACQTMVSQRGGMRCSTAVGYLAPVMERSNLTVRTGAHTTRVLLENRRAIGVEYLRDGEVSTVGAAREVVLCGGAVNTPQLLMLSGIGPAAHLTSLGIDVVVDAPEVGSNLQDHLFAALVVETADDTLFAAGTAEQYDDFVTSQRGMLTSNVAEAYGFVRTSPDLDHPDIEILFAPVPYIGEGLVPAPGHGVSVGAILLQPRSTGTIRLASADPVDKPLIDPNYLSDPDGADEATMLAGLACCERILDAEAFRPTRSGGRFIQPAGSDDWTREQRDAAALIEYSQTLYHPTTTARMGSDPGSVVDPELRVRGVEALRVADASIMPNIIRGHTNAPSIVIGEKAADLLLGRTAAADAAQPKLAAPPKVSSGS